MEVYIEYVIIDNLIINFLLLWSTTKTMGLKSNIYLLGVSSLFGTILSCILPLTPFSGVFLAIIKLIIGLIMVLMVYKFKNVKTYIYSFILFVSYTFLMGGACYAIIILLGGTFENISIGKYDTIVPVSIVILTCFVYAFIIFRFTKYIYRKKDMLPFMQTVDIGIGDKNCTFSAYMDSGNRLYDKQTGAPVIVLSAYALEKYVGQEEIAKLVFGEKSDIFKDIHFLNYGTVGGNAKKMVVFTPSIVKVYTKDKNFAFENVAVGVTFKKFNDAINFDCLLHPSLT